MLLSPSPALPRPRHCILVLGNSWHAIKISNSPTIVPRSEIYQPSIWHYDYIQTLGNGYVGKACAEQSNNLKEHQLELIDILLRLGISYHFEGEMKRILEALYNDDHNGDTWKENLYATALKFRLLRQHEYRMSPEVFNNFKDERRNFKDCLCEDTKGMLSLYEATFLLIEGENILEEARDFATKHLEEYLKKNKDKNLYAISREDMKPILLEFAELDFNMVQAVHQEDLKQVSSTGLGENLSFARNRLMENFYWSVGLIYQPQYGYSRTLITKVDMFLVLYNSVHEMAFDSLKEQGLHIICYLKKAWADLCKSYLLEAKWYYSKYMPNLEEDLKNVWITISSPVILMHSYFIVANPITKEALECLEEGDIPKSIQCYMNEIGTIEKDNQQDVSSPFCQTFIELSMHLARMGHCTYQQGDRFGIADRKTKDSALSLLIQPIPHTRMSHGNS
ncbi:hypothetical protein ACB094_12G116100 [Castanea mollissima]